MPSEMSDRVTDTTRSRVYVKPNRNLIRTESKLVLARGAWSEGAGRSSGRKGSKGTSLQLLSASRGMQCTACDCGW